MNGFRADRCARAAVWLLAAGGFVLLAWLTRPGLGLTPDSLTYLDTARQLLAGRGLQFTSWYGTLQPLTHYPPAYPWLLAQLGRAAPSLEAGARWLQAILFAANIAAGGFLLARMLPTRRGWAWIGALALLAAPPMLEIHTMLWSEALFLTFNLLAALCLAAYLERPAWRALAAAALLAGMAGLTRFLGVVLMGAGFLLVLAAGGGAGKRVARALVFGATAALPVAVWTAYNLRVAGNATNRAVSLHWFSLLDLRTFADTLLVWLLPWRLARALSASTAGALLTLLLAGALAAAGLWAGRSAEPRRRCWGVFWGAYAAAYTAIILVSMAMLDAHVNPDSRTLCPLYVAGFYLVALPAAGLLAACPARARRAVLLGLALYGVFFAARGATLAAHGARDARGYAARAWRKNTLLARLAADGTGRIIYSNSPDLVRYRTGCAAVGVPRRYNPNTRGPDPDAPAQLERMRDDLAAGRAVLAYFRRLERGWLMAERDLAERWPLRTAWEDADGVLYEWNTARNATGAAP